ncbi:di-heme oxidoredictase family protein [Marinicellulosiphila megalodicopiae]|uniref:di-heme oxidoredictase family protein n=1 Tax=Marinicellulosiphila megalodicopiae TaxID=2724896 RepID=UPI003BAE7248
MKTNTTHKLTQTIKQTIKGLPCIALIAASSSAFAKNDKNNQSDFVIGETPAVQTHLDQEDIEDGSIHKFDLIEQGRLIFDARFNFLDGRGRPASTGGGAPRDPHGQPDFLRTSGPDSSSCASCHSQPFSGGAGDFVANVFVLAQILDPVTFSIDPNFSNERNTLGMFGAGAIEMLSREMTADMHNIRDNAIEQAQATGQAVTVDLITKGVSFGQISVLANGLIDPSGIEGVDWDLIIKPFHQKGAVVSLREFTNNAMNHHHGMQTVERFGENTDPDQDGVINELTVGDITAITVFQASLPIPTQNIPNHPLAKQAVADGEVIFSDIGCNECHQTELVLESRLFVEPSPYNPAGNLQQNEVANLYTWDMTNDGQQGAKLKKFQQGAVVNAFTDLKRHNLCDEDFDHFCNEQLTQGSILGYADANDFTQTPYPRPTEVFLTRKLWDAGDSAPYGHRGDLSTLTEAIHFHGGDARESRDAYFDLDQYSQDAIIEFLKSMTVNDQPM